MTLPASYLQALRVQNGGCLRRREHSSDGSVDCISGIGPHHPSLLTADWDQEKAYMEEEEIGSPADIDRLVPLAGDGHHAFCLDYRHCGARGEPCVSRIDIESFAGDEIVGPDVATFVGRLAPSPHRLFGIRSSSDPGAMVATLARHLGVQVEDDQGWAHGYVIHRARIGPPYGEQRADEREGGWIWMSPNRVPRGFIRPDHHRYRELVDMLPGEAWRYPDHQDCPLVIAVSENSQAEDLIRARLPSGPLPLVEIVE